MGWFQAINKAMIDDLLQGIAVDNVEDSAVKDSAVDDVEDSAVDNVIDSAIDNAVDNVEDKNELLDKLIFENADNSELIKLLEEADKAVSVLENLVKVLKQKLYKEILKQKLYEEIKENNINLKEEG